MAKGTDFTLWVERVCEYEFGVQFFSRAKKRMMRIYDPN